MTLSRFVRAALAAALSSTLLLPSLATAIPVGEVATTKPGKVIDMSMIKPLFKKKSKAVIAGYQVGFVTHNKASAYAGGGSGARSTMETFLGNVDYALMQQIADAAYADYVKKLQEAGIEVIDAEKVKASANFQALETTPADSAAPYKVNYQGADMVVVPAAGLPLWFNQYDGLNAAGNKGKKNLKHMAALAKEFDAAVLQPSMVVDFSWLDTSGGQLARKARVEAGTSPYMVAAATVFWGTTDGGLSYAKFPGGLWSTTSTGKFAEASSDNNLALVKGLGYMGIDIGAVRSKKAVVLEADPATYKGAVLELLGGASETYKRAIQDIRD
ncbi:MAG: hypothetical protein K0S16_1679 [Moraxellaceae bacterium]|jgi:hypothetical protein|nr:hypothetical protein [Moraxellaceae bacterium]